MRHSLARASKRVASAIHVEPYFDLFQQLRHSGWIRSLREGRPVDQHGGPLPWLPYPLIRFIESRRELLTELDLFEYGSGYGTLWWSRLVSSVTSLEHDAAWHCHMQSLLPGNVSLTLAPLENAYYPQAIGRTGREYDLVLVDGRMRVACVHSAMEALSPRGAIILDNSERDRYQDAVTSLSERGFRSVPFVGLAPQSGRLCQSTVFYRDGNCLQL